MRISSSQIALSSQYHYKREHEVSERLQVRTVQRQGNTTTTTDLEVTNQHNNAASRKAIDSQNLLVTLQQRGEVERVSLQMAQQRVAEKGKPDQLTKLEKAVDENQKELADDARLQILVSVVQQLTGREVEWFDSEKLRVSEERLVRPEELEQPPASEATSWGMRYERHEVIKEEERSQFHAKGVVETADGKSIEVELSLNMSRRFVEESHLVITEGEALKDPLVINFSGSAAQLTERKYQFDIDADGTKEAISFVTPQSGFVALDKNGDGMINSGAELFGALSGDGFAELSVYDQDQNGWIDESDPVFNQLQVWSKDQEGKDQLLAIGYYNVGALYLERSETPFEINTAENEMLGQIRSSGLYLEESGVAKTLQQVDLVI